MTRNTKNTKYIISGNNEVYKVIPDEDYVLKVSPWNIGEDRRLSKYEIGDDFKSVNFNKAREIINDQWDRDEREWDFDGHTYKVYNSKEKDYKTTFEYPSDIQPYEFEYSYTDTEGNSRMYMHRYYLCMFQGKIYWLQLSQYNPQVQLYNFIDIYTEPSYRGFAQWTNVKHCKKIYKL